MHGQQNIKIKITCLTTPAVSTYHCATLFFKILAVSVIAMDLRTPNLLSY